MAANTSMREIVCGVLQPGREVPAVERIPNDEESVRRLIGKLGDRRPLPGRYNGYTSCPLVTSRNGMLLAGFDYDLKRAPTFPLISTLKPRYDMWLLKRYGLCRPLLAPGAPPAGWADARFHAPA